MVVTNMFPGELIGKNIIILTASDQKLIGWHVRIVDETKTSLIVSGMGKTKTLLKSGISFKLDETGQIISGKEIMKRPEDRIKGK